MPTIKADDMYVRLTGRIAVENNEARFYWPSSYAAVRFRGTRIACRVRPHVVWGCNYLGVVVDGRLSKAPILMETNDTVQTLVLAENLAPEQSHTVTVFKMSDCACFYTLLDFETDGDFLPPEPREALRLEFYGDSVTSGCCVEAEDFLAMPDPPHVNGCFDNAWWSYAWQCARLLHAEMHSTSQGGIAVRSGTGYYHLPDGIGMDVSWDRLSYIPEAGDFTKWDFSRFVPHAVILALGQNDHHDAVKNTNDITLSDPETKTAWKEAYKRIARGIASSYPKGTPLVFITTLIMHDREWDDAILEIAEELRAEGIPATRLLFRRAGSGTPGHPRIAEQKEMALELAEYLKSLLQEPDVT